MYKYANTPITWKLKELRNSLFFLTKALGSFGYFLIFTLTLAHFLEFPEITCCCRPIIFKLQIVVYCGPTEFSVSYSRKLRLNFDIIKSKVYDKTMKLNSRESKSQ